MPRFHCAAPLACGQLLALPASAARHVQVLRLQPGARITLFNGDGGEFEAVIEHMGRIDVDVRVETHLAVEREATPQVHLALGIPANERMDWLIEKATELGAASIQPLLSERTVLKLDRERAARKRSHWQGIAIAACEQCGRNRVPPVHPLADLHEWLDRLRGRPADSPSKGEERWLLSPDPNARPLSRAAAGAASIILLSGPEGGLSSAEESAARASGFLPASLGARVLRAETAPLAALVRCMD